MGKSLLKYFGIFGLLIVVVAISFAISFQIFAPRYFVPYVIDKVQENTNGRYVLSANSDNVKVNFYSMSLDLGFTELRRDSTVGAYSGIDLLDKFDIYASFQSFRIGTIQLINLVRNKRIVVNEISLFHPDIIVRKNAGYNPDQVPSLSDSTTLTGIAAVHDSAFADSLAWYEFKEARNAFFPAIQIGNFTIDSAVFTFYGAAKRYPLYMVRGLDFTVSGFLFDDRGKTTIKDASIYIDSVSMLVSKSIARLNLKGVYLHPDSVHIAGLHYGHIVDRFRINSIKGFRASWLNINARDIHISGIDPARMISDSMFVTQKVSVGTLNLYLFKDKHEMVIDPKHKPLPPETIRSIPIPLKIDTLEVQDGLLVIDMLAPKAIAPGTIRLNDFYARILNITNNPEALVKNPEMILNAEFKVMESADISLKARFLINSEEDMFNVQVSARPFDITILNGFLGSQFFIEFASGSIDTLHFQFDGNNKANVGTMDLEYSKLRVRKLKDYEAYLADKPKTGLLAGLGNMIIRNNLSFDDKNYKPGVIYYEKEYNRDFIHGTIMSLLSGATSAMGLTSKNLEKKQEEAISLDVSDTQKSEAKALEKAEKAAEEREVNENIPE